MIVAGIGPVVEGLTSGWALSPGPPAAAAFAGALYLAGVRAVARERRLALAGGAGRRHRRAWPVARTAAFLAGLAAAVVALQSGLDARAGELMSVHMAQHLLLSMLAAPLLVTGAPVSLALRALRGAPRRAVADAVRSTPGRALTHPATTWTLSAAIVAVLHVPALYGAALDSPVLHAFEHQLLLVAGLLFWLPLIDGNPVARHLDWLGRTGYLLAAMVPMAALGSWFVYADGARYDAYVAAAGGDVARALEDQQVAGALMWVGGKLVMAAALLVLVTQALLREERRQAARDAHAAARRRARMESAA